MKQHSFAASATIDAPSQVLFGIIEDYLDGHQRILPRPPFVSLVVEQGGRGAGTVFRVEMRVLGVPGGYRSVVTVPEPGRVLVETNDNGYVTTFTVDPRGAGRALVTFSTLLPARPPVLGRLEAWLVARLMTPVYEKELAQLARVALEARREA